MPRRHWTMTLARVGAWSLGGVVIAFATMIAALFLHVASLPWAPARTVLAGAFVIAIAGAFILLKPRWKALLVFAVLFGGAWLWYALIPASNDRAWQPDVARVVSVDFDGDLVTVHNVRAFHYRSVDDYDEIWETRTYDLSTLRTTDTLFSYWGPRNIAHTMLSFGFDDGEHLVISVETRKEVGETYDAVRSLFKQFELIYIVGDERDLIGLRTNHRGEDTYLFPVARDPAETRALLVDILRRADSLGREPEHYRTIRDNCTTSLLTHIDRAAGRRTPFSFKLLLNGYIPELAYERGRIPSDAPFDVVMQRYAISEKARTGGDGPGFSERIRVGAGPTVTRPSG